MPAAFLRPFAGLAVMLGLCSMIGESGAQQSQHPQQPQQRQQPQPPIQATPDSAAAAPAGLIRFDIPGQSLHEALQQYGATTGRSLLYDSKAIAGRNAAPVSGLYTPQDALRQLLAGSGMMARYTSQEAFLLVPATPEQGADATDAVDANAASAMEAQLRRRYYYARMQARVTEVLCADPVTAPGSYRLALRFRIDANNIVRRLEVHATGRPGLDSRVRARLAGLDLRAAPPADVKQPVTLLVLPDAGEVC